MFELEKCESACPECGQPVAFEWDGGFVSRPEAVLVADWVFHGECYDHMVDRADREASPRDL